MKRTVTLEVKLEKRTTPRFGPCLYVVIPSWHQRIRDRERRAREFRAREARQRARA